MTIKVCLLISLLLIAASGITCVVISGFLPTYYSSRLEQELDTVSQEMAETISGYEKIEDAFFAIELFEAGAQVSVVILDERGNEVWPGQADAVVEYSNAEQEAWEISDAMEAGGSDQADNTANANAGERDDVCEAVTEEDTEEKSAGVERIDGVSVVEAGDEAAEYAQSVIVEVLMPADAAEQANGTENSVVKHYDAVIGDARYTMLVSGGMQPVNQAMDILYQIFPYILMGSVVAAVLFAAAASLYLTAPMVKLSRTAQKMAALDFRDRYQGSRTDEIGKLGKSLNELSANLSQALGELYEANEKLKADIEKERETERRQIEFFSAVSHELKTPLTILQGHLSGMLQGVGEYRNRERYLRRALATADKMEGMVEELLTVSRIENNTFTACRTDIAEQLRLQLADMTEMMEEKNLEPVVTLPDHVYAEVNPGMMEKVFRNLLINAVRYTPAGGGRQIRVKMSVTETGRQILCFVENTGVFLPEEALPHLFEAFYRAEQSRNSQTGGSGLGLYIVKMVLEQHGAQYGMENTAEGVRVWFTIKASHQSP